jgi:hypothetical protein
MNNALPLRTFQEQLADSIKDKGINKCCKTKSTYPEQGYKESKFKITKFSINASFANFSIFTLLELRF